MSTSERLQERTRIETILTSAHATGRGELAQHLAFKTDTPADAALTILATTAPGGRTVATAGALTPEELAKRVNAENGIGARNERQASAVAGGALSAEEVARRVSAGAA